MKNYIFLLSAIFSMAYAQQPPTIMPTNIDAPRFESEMVCLDSIIVVGNVRTKSRAVIADMHMREGKCYESETIQQLLLDDYTNVYNAAFYQKIEISAIKLSEDRMHVKLRVWERMKLYGLPLAQSTEDNLLNWARDNQEFKELSYGATLLLRNAFGYNSRIYFRFLTGLNEEYALGYQSSFAANHFLAWRIDIGTIQHRFFPYVVDDHEEESLLTPSQTQFRQYEGAFTLLYRYSLTVQHDFVLGYTAREVENSVLSLNRRYLSSEETTQNFLAFEYSFAYDSRDLVPSPLEGDLLVVSVGRKGLGFSSTQDLTEFRISLAHYMPIGKRFIYQHHQDLYTSFSSRSSVSLLDQMPLGEVVPLRGYGDFLLAGQTQFAIEEQLRYRLWTDSFQLRRDETFFPVLVDVYAAVQTARFLSYETEFRSPLAQEWLASASLGVELVTKWDVLIGAYYSIALHAEPSLSFYFAFAE